MFRVLVIGMTSTAGGVESFLMNYCKKINWEKIQFDFLCSSEKKIVYEKDLINLGAKVFYIEPKRKNIIRHRKELDNFFKEHSKKYKSVWANLNSLMNVDYLEYAKKYNISRIIVHSHNSANMGGIWQRLLHELNKKRISKLATDYWACSEKASNWFYPSKIRKNTKIIHNAIDVEKYSFNKNKRDYYRKLLKAENRKVIGNIGRLHFQKNQEFMLDLMKIIVEKNPNYMLVLIGEGPDKEKLIYRTKELGLEDYVFFFGQQNDVGGWLSAFDCLLFPSRFEGLSIVALEAQANGLPIVASLEAISEEGIINDNIYQLGLNYTKEEWMINIIKHSFDARANSKQIKKRFLERGFVIEIEAKNLEKYFEGIN